MSYWQAGIQGFKNILGGGILDKAEKKKLKAILEASNARISQAKYNQGIINERAEQERLYGDRDAADVEFLYNRQESDVRAAGATASQILKSEKRQLLGSQLGQLASNNILVNQTDTVSSNILDTTERVYDLDIAQNDYNTDYLGGDISLERERRKSQILDTASNQQIELYAQSTNIDFDIRQERLLQKSSKSTTKINRKLIYLQKGTQIADSYFRYGRNNNNGGGTNRAASGGGSARSSRGALGASGYGGGGPASQ